MAKRTIIPVLVVSAAIAVFAVQPLSKAGGPNGPPRSSDAERRRNLTEAEKQREATKREAARRLELEREYKESRKMTARLAERAKTQRQEQQKKIQEAKAEFLWEKRALTVAGLTEEQWKLIKPKLERVRELRGRARSTVGLFLTSSPASGQNPVATQSQSVPTWEWHISWKDNALAEQTEAQKLAAQLVGLVKRQNTAPGTLRRTMDALRKARREEVEIEKQLSEAREELREGLTTRQEAALVLMRWL